MKKNRKNADTYRFNGNPSIHAHSIHPVSIADLESRIEEFEAKLSDPNDPDDPKWTALVEEVPVGPGREAQGIGAQTERGIRVPPAQAPIPRHGRRLMLS